MNDAGELIKYYDDRMTPEEHEREEIDRQKTKKILDTNLINNIIDTAQRVIAKNGRTKTTTLNIFDNLPKSEIIELLNKFNISIPSESTLKKHDLELKDILIKHVLVRARVTMLKEAHRQYI